MKIYLEQVILKRKKFNYDQFSVTLKSQNQCFFNQCVFTLLKCKTCLQLTLGITQGWTNVFPFAFLMRKFSLARKIAPYQLINDQSKRLINLQSINESAICIRRPDYSTKPNPHPPPSRLFSSFTPPASRRQIWTTKQKACGRGEEGASDCTSAVITPKLGAYGNRC